MKLIIEFDHTDFRSMLVDFFEQAGYSITDTSLLEATETFRTSFPAGTLSLSVTPNPVDTLVAVDTRPTNTDASEVNTVDSGDVQDPSALPVPPDEVILPYAKVTDPEYQEMQSVLNLSRSLERERT